MEIAAVPIVAASDETVSAIAIVATSYVAAASSVAVAAIEVMATTDMAAVAKASVTAAIVVAAPAPSVKVPALVFETVAIAPVAVTVEAAAIPRAHPDELTSQEILRAPVAVRRAIIRIVIVVAVWTYRRCHVAAVNRPNPDAYGYLSLGVARCKQEDSKHSKVL